MKKKKMNNELNRMIFIVVPLFHYVLNKFEDLLRIAKINKYPSRPKDKLFITVNRTNCSLVLTGSTFWIIFLAATVELSFGKPAVSERTRREF